MDAEGVRAFAPLAFASIVLCLAACSGGGSEPPKTLSQAFRAATYTTPRQVDLTRLAGPFAGACVVEAPEEWRSAADEMAAALAARLPGAGCGVPVRVVSDAVITADGFLIRTAEDGMTVSASNLRALHYALAVAPLLAGDTLEGSCAGCLVLGTVADHPSLPIRGIIEGFYGPPYTVALRDTILRLAAQTRMNRYVYGPKDDRYCRFGWKDPYPPEAGAAIAAAAKTAEDLGIEFTWAISPGSSETSDKPICYSCADDLALIEAKLKAMRALGVDSFGLFLDDIAAQLVHEADKAKYASFVDAQIDFTNRVAALVRSLGVTSPLLWVGTAYSNDYAGWEPYADALGAGLDASVQVMWTGPIVLSHTITAEQMRLPRERLKRKTVIWDNWPVKVEPYGYRAPDLAQEIDGLVANPVTTEISKLPEAEFLRLIGPIGAYAWNSEAYESQAAFEAWQPIANAALTGGTTAASLR